MSEEELLIETVGLVRILRINRPRARNALSLGLRQRIAAALQEADCDRDTRAVVITGDRDVFSVGGDIREFGRFSSSYEATLENQRVWRLMPFLTIPIIAAVEGLALGGGAELALHADIIIAGDSAQFGFPEVALGILPGNGGTQRFTRIVGKQLAMRYLLTGERFTAEQALSMGLASEVVPAGCALDRASELAARIADLPPLAVRRIKDVVLNGADLPLAPALALERNGYLTLQQTADHAEAARAFSEKRTPQFSGS